MYVNIKLKKNFSTAWNSCIEKYGDEFAKLNGFSDDLLDYTDFIQNFIDEDTVSDASIDSNANVGHKDIVTLMKEMSKPHQKLLAFNKIFYEINKKYGYPTAKTWLELEWSRALYLHDASTSSFIPYCYKGDEMMTVKYEGEILHISFRELYDYVNDKEEFDPSINQNAKFPKNLYVLDSIDETPVFTRVYRIVKHKNDKQMRFIKLSNGLSQVVTADHPIITERGDVPALSVTKKDKVYTMNSVPFDNSISSITIERSSYHHNSPTHCIAKGSGTFELNKDTGWLLGISLSDSSIHKSAIVISQNKGGEWDKVIKICDKHDIPYTIRHDKKWGDTITIRSCPFVRWVTTSESMCTSQLNRCLPSDYIHYSYEFLDGVVAGMIDGDGSVWGESKDSKRGCSINTISETLMHQLSSYLQYRNSFCNDSIPWIGKSGRYNSYDIVPKHPLHGIYFNIGMNEDYLTNIGSYKIETVYTPRKRKKGIFANKQYQFHYGYVNILENVPYPVSCKDVYDITTATGHFICNNILSHNCFAYDLKRLAEEGQFFQENYNNCPPKHLDTFIDFVKEFVSYTSNRTSGACGLPNLIPYMYYFWREDIKNHHMGITGEYGEKYAKQNIQRFIYAVNQTYVRDNCQSAFTNTSVFDRHYLTALFGGSTFPDGSFMIDDLEGIMQFQIWYMEKMSEIHEENMFTFPVNSISLLKKDGKFQDEKFARWAIRHNMKWYDSNIFCSDEVTSLSNCCRLKSNIKDLGYFDRQQAIEKQVIEDMYPEYLDSMTLEEFKDKIHSDEELSSLYQENVRKLMQKQRNDESLGFMNSIGGTSLRVGSVKVSTINLARIALECDDEESYIQQLKKISEIDLIVLDCVRHIIERNVQKDMLPNYCDGMIDIKTQYNTIGIIGIYETMKTFGYTKTDEFGNTFYTDDAMRFGNKIFEAINEVIDEFKQDKDYMINIEQVPGEQAAVKFMKADMMLYPHKCVKDLPLYGNQFIPLGIKTTLQERIRISAAFDSYCNGGSITHINIESPNTDFDQIWDLLNYITDQGITYFAFTTKIQVCKNNHAFFGHKCPKCGCRVETEYARVVGFFTPIRTWSKDRKAEYSKREWLDLKDFCLSDDEIENLGILN